jgi:putative CocE/NonD family hydrolase
MMDGVATPIAQWYAERGYAFAYVNSRGTGNSGGVSVDEYMAEETQDSVDAIEFLAAQEWSSGSVGMLGTSYSGFTTVQVAARAPPALKAIAPAYFTDRRYTDDCHYKGGSLRGFYDMLSYGLGMVAANAMPPFPAAAGPDWSEMWQQRLDLAEPYLLKWLSHPTEDDYWRQGSIGLDGGYSAIKAPALLIGGWNDGYLSCPLRTFQEISSPKKLLMGPWQHAYGHTSRAGPRIDIYREMLRWWDHWLKGMDNGVAEEIEAQPVQVYVREFEQPHPGRTEVKGEWRGSKDLPVQQTFPAPSLQYSLAPAGELRLGPLPAGTASGSVGVKYRPGGSLNGGVYDSGGNPPALPGPQNRDEASSVNFTSAEIENDLYILGIPTFSLNVSFGAEEAVEVAGIAVRLCEVGPDGTSVLVTKGFLNATRRESMTNPMAIPASATGVAASPLKLQFHFEGACWKFTKGHCIRVSINGSDFPNIWPTPTHCSINVHFGEGSSSGIELPVWDGGALLHRPLPPSTEAPLPALPWLITTDLFEETHTLRTPTGAGSKPQSRRGGEYGVSDRDPAVAWCSGVARREAAWPGVEVSAEATGTLTSDEQSFHIAIAVRVELNDELFHTNSWTHSVPRMLM